MASWWRRGHILSRFSSKSRVVSRQPLDEGSDQEPRHRRWRQRRRQWRSSYLTATLQHKSLCWNHVPSTHGDNTTNNSCSCGHVTAFDVWGGFFTIVHSQSPSFPRKIFINLPFSSYPWIHNVARGALLLRRQTTNLRQTKFYIFWGFLIRVFKRWP